MTEEIAAQLEISVIIQIFLKEFILKPPRTHLFLVITQSWTDVYRHPVRFQFMSVHLTLPHEFRGRSDRECQDLRLGRLGVPRPARIADQAEYGPLHPARATRADLVSSRNLPAGQADHSTLISPVCGSGSLRDARDLPGN